MTVSAFHADLCFLCASTLGKTGHLEGLLCSCLLLLQLLGFAHQLPNQLLAVIPLLYHTQHNNDNYRFASRCQVCPDLVLTHNMHLNNSL